MRHFLKGLTALVAGASSARHVWPWKRAGLLLRRRLPSVDSSSSSFFTITAIHSRCARSKLSFFGSLLLLSSLLPPFFPNADHPYNYSLDHRSRHSFLPFRLVSALGRSAGPATTDKPRGVGVGRQSRRCLREGALGQDPQGKYYLFCPLTPSTNERLLTTSKRLKGISDEHDVRTPQPDAHQAGDAGARRDEAATGHDFGGAFQGHHRDQAEGERGEAGD